MRELSELEGAVLGVIEERSRCTAYAVRKVFRESPVHHWQASAGAIYPVVSRLESADLLASEPAARGRQETLVYEVTPTGKRALRAWVSRQSKQLAVPPDPLRTRIFFFSQLSEPERRSVLTDTRAEIQAITRRLEADSRRHEEDDRFAYLASRGALAVARARLDWIEEMLEEPAVGGSGSHQGARSRAGGRPAARGRSSS